MEDIIKFRNVLKLYNNRLVINNVSFAIKKNSLTTIIGPNGAGKTSIAKLALKLENPTKGYVEYANKLKVSYVPQKIFFKSNIPITVKNFLSLLAPEWNAKAKLAKVILEFAAFEKLKMYDIAALSGGQLQRLIIAASLLANPEFIVLDEPMQGLDPSSQQEFYSIIEQYKAQSALTILMISHDLFTVMKNSDQVICFNQHICCSGKPDDLKNDKTFISNLANIGFYTHHHDHSH